MSGTFRTTWGRPLLPHLTHRRDALRTLGLGAIATLSALGTRPRPLDARTHKRKRKRKKKGSKRQRCQRKKRTFCAGRCCPGQHRCESEACIASCADPKTTPSIPGSACGNGGACFCTTTIAGSAACLADHENPYCLAGQLCSSTNLCPPGQMCGACSCGATTCNFRCYDPCPTV